MAEAGETNVRKKEREPITLVCFVVFIVASVAVLGAYVDGAYINKSVDTVQYGDSVSVDYTGSLYGYYDAGTDTMAPVIFDTSVESVGTNSDNLFLKTFSKTSYSTLSLTVGSGSMLAAFENALVGHNIGDTVRVCIPAGEGYNLGNFNTTGTSFTFNQKMTVTASDFKSFYGVSETISSTYYFEYMGMSLMATPNEGTSMIDVTYMVTEGSEYTVYENSKLGTVKMTIGDITTAGVIPYTLTITGYKEVENVTVEGVNAIEMITLAMFPGVSTNIVGYDSSTKTVAYNNVTDSKAILSNTDLYFVITILERT